MRILHFLLIFFEVFALVTMSLFRMSWCNGVKIIHASPWIPILILSTGCGIAVASIAIRYSEMRTLVVGSIEKYFYRCCAVFGVSILVAGIAIVMWMFPSLFRYGKVYNAEERMSSFDAVSVRFNAEGGFLEKGEHRIVRYKRGYGEVLNLYPSEDERLLAMNGAKIELQTGLFFVEKKASSTARAFINYFPHKIIPLKYHVGSWVYVVDMAELSGTFTEWAVGQTDTTNLNEFAQMSCGHVRPTIKAGEKQFLVLDSTKWGEKCNMLDRAYIHLKPGQHLKAKFRVSLFAGTGVNESNYHYVKPGETIACKLPVPTREGYAFEGWYDGDKRVTEETKVVKRETHTLKARWRKL